jgi:uncharacterized membrane protein YeaQ/YmgE (transglycosylase-associated protein family)
MGIILWIVFGAIVGWIASSIANTSEGLLVDIIIGIIGSVIGGWIMSYLGYGGVSGFNLYSFLVALLGAIIFLVIIKVIRKI